jgi:hypothetical protein
MVVVINESRMWRSKKLNFKKASAYFESLYEKRKLTHKQYPENTELKDLYPLWMMMLPECASFNND